MVPTCFGSRPGVTVSGAGGHTNQRKPNGGDFFKIPVPPQRARMPGLSRNTGPVAGWRNPAPAPRVPSRPPRPRIAPLVTSTATVARSVGNTTKDNLMNMDDTLLNAVDLAGIEQLATQRERSAKKRKEPEGDRGGSIINASRLYAMSPEVKSSSPKRSKSTSKYVVLDMTAKDTPESRRSLPEGALNRHNAPHVGSLSATIPNSRRNIEQWMERSSTPKREEGSKKLPPPVFIPAKIPKEPTVDLFPYDSQLLDMDLSLLQEANVSLTSPNRKVAAQTSAKAPNVIEHEDDDYFPSYQVVDQNCSQLFLAEVERKGKRPLTQVGAPLQSNEMHSIVKNNALCSQYIRLERSMMEENDANILDDQVDSQLAREFDSSQQRQHILDVFDEFERTLVNTTNVELNPPEDPDLANINWEEDVTIAGEKPALAEAISNRTLLANIFGTDRKSSVPVSNGSSPKLVARKSAPLVSSHFKDMGPFFGLPTAVKHLIEKYRGIKELYDWQKECLGLKAIVERLNLIYALPTSGGKTLVAEIIMLREVMLRNRNVLFIVPYVSLAQEKLAALSPFAVDLAFLVEEYSGGKGSIPPRKRKHKNSIFVCTIEKAAVLFDSLIETDRANEIGLVVIDELHMIGEERRGVNLEVLLTKIQAIQAGIQVIGMSATIGNLNEIAGFMSADIYCRDFRPVELREYVKCGSDLLEINSKARRLDEAFVNKNTIEYDYSEDQRRVDPDHVIGLVLDVMPKNSCLLFCPTKRQCEQLCHLLTEHLPRELLLYRKKEKEELVIALRAENPAAELLSSAFLLGIAYHHSGLTFDERKLIEDAYRLGILSLIICTSTLAAGVNLPAKRVIIRSPYIATNFITLSRYKQMAGRAGRAGLGENGDSILICQKKDIAAVCDLLCSPMDEANSSLHVDDGVHLKNLVLSAVGLGICSTRNDIQRFVSKTLLAIQAARLKVDVRTLTDRVVQTLYKENAIKAKSDGCRRNPANMTICFDESENSQAEPVQANFSNPVKELTVTRGAEGSSQEGKLVKTLKKNTRLEVNRLGKAAIRAGFHMEKAHRFYEEMVRVGERLNVLDERHLLYLVVLEDDGTVRPAEADLVSFITSLTGDSLILAKKFHIGEFTIAKILSNRSVPSNLKPSLGRFFRMVIVHELWNLKPAQTVAAEYRVDAGSIQSLMTNAASTASGLLRMCEELTELWAFRQLLATMVQRLSHCCTSELIPLMELPGVKIGRARQLWRAGFTSLASIAGVKSSDLVTAVEYMNYRTANQLILSAKAKLMEQVEELRDRVEDYLQVIR